MIHFKIRFGIFLFNVLVFLVICSGSNQYPANNLLHRDVSILSIKGLKHIQRKGEDVYVVNSIIDLKSKVITMPNNSTLEFNGGLMKNGTIVGRNTKLLYHGVCFDNITIQGTWNVQEINTSMFKDLISVNSLRNLIALSNSNVYNHIVIDEGLYVVRSLKDDLECIRILSNTEIELRGTIVLEPNNFAHYYIFRITGNNIKITGGGSIIGDKTNHTGTKGEWGMGIFIWDGNNVTISGVNISDCWGDCVYIGGNSDNVLIDNCNLDNGRRQGISITSGGKIEIINTQITNVGGTAPETGIDIEPNAGKSVNEVNIRDVKLVNCVGGILAYGYEDDANIGTIMIEKCSIFGSHKVPLRFYGCKTVSIVNNIVDYRKGEDVVVKEQVGNYRQNNLVIR